MTRSLSVALFAAAVLTLPAHAQVGNTANFPPLRCFAGQIRVDGKKMKRRPYQLFKAKDDSSCCGDLVKTGRTDEHGHFFVEPLNKGRYYAKFETQEAERTVSFALINTYKKCDASFVEIRIAKDGSTSVQNYVGVDEAGGPECDENEPSCYRK